MYWELRYSVPALRPDGSPSVTAAGYYALWSGHWDSSPEFQTPGRFVPCTGTPRRTWQSCCGRGSAGQSAAACTPANTEGEVAPAGRAQSDKVKGDVRLPLWWCLASGRVWGSSRPPALWCGGFGIWPLCRSILVQWRSAQSSWSSCCAGSCFSEPLVQLWGEKANARLTMGTKCVYK